MRPRCVFCEEPLPTGGRSLACGCVEAREARLLAQADPARGQKMAALLARWDSLRADKAAWLTEYGEPKPLEEAEE